jgi:hypothetical protein
VGHVILPLRYSPFFLLTHRSLWPQEELTAANSRQINKNRGSFQASIVDGLNKRFPSPRGPECSDASVLAPNLESESERCSLVLDSVIIAAHYTFACSARYSVPEPPTTSKTMIPKTNAPCAGACSS